MTTYYDVFNGDADGILSLVQLRLANSLDSILVTGPKRDIPLLKRVEAKADDVITVLDVSMEKNHDALLSVLAAGAKVQYMDHHRAGDIPAHDNLDAHIDLDPNTCTALIVNKLLDSQYVEWAIAAAYGDNMIASAEALADEVGLDTEQRAFLRELGVLVNYNGYGESLDDLHYDPAVLFLELVHFESPFLLQQDSDSVYYKLKAAYDADFANLAAIQAFATEHKVTAYVLPAETWSRRVSGVFGNNLANETTDKAHLVLTLNSDGESYTVSLRAPLNNKVGAGDICSSFATGGGRAAAAGINQLPAADIDRLVTAVNDYYS